MIFAPFQSDLYGFWHGGPRLLTLI